MNPIPSSEPITNLTFDELPLGARARISRTLTQDDIVAFALVSGDVNPAHVDPEYANATRFHGTIAHGMWAGAMISSLLGTEFPGPGTIYEGQTLRFHLPVRAGDTLTAEAVVTARDVERHRLTLDCVVTNQTGATVVSGEALVRAPMQKVSRARAALPQMHLFDPAARLARWIDGWAADLAGQPPVQCGVVHPCDATSLAGALAAARRGLIVPWLIGPEAKIRALAEQAGLDLGNARIEAVEHSHAAAARAAELAARPDAEDAPTRRSIGDRTPTVQALADAAERAIEPLNERTRAILAEAAAADQLVVVVFGMPAEAQDDPSAWYEAVKAQFDQPSVHAAAVMRRLVELSYERTETPGDTPEDLEFDWATVRSKVLNHADLEIADQQVLELYREPSSIPFDPASYGERPPS